MTATRTRFISTVPDGFAGLALLKYDKRVDSVGQWIDDVVGQHTGFYRGQFQLLEREIAASPDSNVGGSKIAHIVFRARVSQRLLRAAGYRGIPPVIRGQFRGFIPHLRAFLFQVFGSAAGGPVQHQTAMRDVQEPLLRHGNSISEGLCEVLARRRPEYNLFDGGIVRRGGPRRTMRESSAGGPPRRTTNGLPRYRRKMAAGLQIEFSFAEGRYFNITARYRSFPFSPGVMASFRLSSLSSLQRRERSWRSSG